MRLHELQPPDGARRQRKRVGRGIAAGQGKTAGRGQKGQLSRSSVELPRAFEGGQMPATQRLPKLRGFHNVNRKRFAVVNLGKLNRFDAGAEVGPEALKEAGLIKRERDGVKVLAVGELKVALKVSAHRFSAGARERIEAAGGKALVIGGEQPRKAARQKQAGAPAPERSEEPDGIAEEETESKEDKEG